MTRIATGMTLLLLLAAAGCGGDDNDGGSVNPFSPTGVTSSAPMDTTNAQSGGGLTNLTAAGMRSAKPDKNTVDFSGVNWEWNEARSHLEPGQLPGRPGELGVQRLAQGQRHGAHPHLQ